jgi:hypothetical protein
MRFVAVGRWGCSEPALTPRDNARTLRTTSQRRAPIRWIARGPACFFRSKNCQYAPVRTYLLQDEAPPHRPPLVALAMTSITSSASAVPGRALAELTQSSIAKISAEAIKRLKLKIADVTPITAVLRYTASSIYLPFWSSPFL